MIVCARTGFASPSSEGNHCGKHEGTAAAKDVSPVQILVSFC
ncbi:MAG TPA: hypothetical protein VFQ31_08780 [Methyloceanibacter sp.]|nr:hypothetical protein [Methyloceanibacter sp.]